MKYLDESGQVQEKTASGLLARIILHENDHLNGVLFTDLAKPQSLIDRKLYMEQQRN